MGDIKPTRNDQELINKAKKLDHTDWSLPLAWTDNAETEQTKEKLISIAIKLYRKEEAAAGLL